MKQMAKKITLEERQGEVHMIPKIEKRLKLWQLILGILVVIIPLFVYTVQTVDLLNATAKSVSSLDLRINEVEMQSKAEDQRIRNEIVEANSTTQTKLAEIQVSVAIANTNIQYLVKGYDKQKEYDK